MRSRSAYAALMSVLLVAATVVIAASVAAQDIEDDQAATARVPATVAAMVETDSGVQDEFEFVFGGEVRGRATDVASEFGSALDVFSFGADGPDVRTSLEDGDRLRVTPNVLTAFDAVYKTAAETGYPVTLVDPGPDYELTHIECLEMHLPDLSPGAEGLVSSFEAVFGGGGERPSSSDAATRTASLGLDLDEIVFCSFGVRTVSSAQGTSQQHGECQPDADDRVDRITPSPGRWTIRYISS